MYGRTCFSGRSFVNETELEDKQPVAFSRVTVWVLWLAILSVTFAALSLLWLNSH
jgi:hypothetical protein